MATLTPSNHQEAFVPSPASRSRRRTFRAVVVALVVAIAVLPTLAGCESPKDEAASARLSALTEPPEEVWTITSTAEPVGGVRAGDRVVITFRSDGEAYAAAFDIETGTEVWRTRPVINGSVTTSVARSSLYVAVTDSDGVTSVKQLDSSDGSELTEQTLRDRYRFVDQAEFAHVLVADEPNRIAVIAADGDLATRPFDDVGLVTAEQITLIADDEITAFDLSDLEPLAPSVGTGFDSVVYADEHRFAGDGETLSRLDAEGRIDWTISARVGTDLQGVPVRTGRLAVEGREGYGLIDIGSSPGRSLWAQEVDGDIWFTWDDDDEAYFIIADDPGDGLSIDDLSAALVDDPSGVSEQDVDQPAPEIKVVRLDEDGPVEVGAVERGADSDDFVVTDGALYRIAAEDGVAVATSYELPGLRELWSTKIGSTIDDRSYFAPFDGALAGVTDSEDTFRITLFR